MTDDELIDAHREKIRAVHDKAGLCGCGSDEGKWGVVLWVLEHAGNWPKLASFYDEEKANPTLGPWIEFAVQVVDSYGLLEHGSSWSGSWLEGHEEGIGAAFLSFLHKYGIDSFKWPEWATGAEPRSDD